MIRVACVGITVMDRIYYVEGLPTESGKYVARNYTEVGGGPAVIIVLRKFERLTNNFRCSVFQFSA